MDSLLNSIVPLSRWCGAHLSEISLAIVAVLLVLFGSLVGKHLKQVIGHINIILRVIIIAIIYMVIFGLAINYLPSFVRQGLNQLNDYSLFPVILLITIFMGMVADRDRFY